MQLRRKEQVYRTNVRLLLMFPRWNPQSQKQKNLHLDIAQLERFFCCLFCFFPRCNLRLQKNFKLHIDNNYSCVILLCMVVAVPTRISYSCFCTFGALTYIYNKPWVTATNSGFIVCKRLARKSKDKKALGVATYRVIAKVRISAPPQERARCKSCLTPSTAYRGERQYKK